MSTALLLEAPVSSELLETVNVGAEWQLALILTDLQRCELIYQDYPYVTIRTRDGQYFIGHVIIEKDGVAFIKIS